MCETVCVCEGEEKVVQGDRERSRVWGQALVHGKGETARRALGTGQARNAGRSGERWTGACLDEPAGCRVWHRPGDALDGGGGVGGVAFKLGQRLVDSERGEGHLDYNLALDVRAWPGLLYDPLHGFV